ncbi:glutamate receptor ionotropic, kainate 2-like isoform X2 [Apostichopus japonicus]
MDVVKHVCKLLEHGVVAIFGPTSTEGAVTTRSLCNIHNVPHIDTRSDFSIDTDSNGSISFAPQPKHVSHVVKEIIKEYRWSKIAILYHEEEGLGRVKEILPMSVVEDIDMTFFPIGRNYKSVLKKLKNSGQKNVLIDCRREICIKLIDKMLELQMLRAYYRYLFLSMDVHLPVYENYSGDDVNMTILHLTNRSSSYYKNITKEWKKRTDGSELMSESALMIDAVHVVVNGVITMEETLLPVTLKCGEPHNRWHQGARLTQEILDSQYDRGLTGPMDFDDQMNRLQPRIFVSELYHEDMEQIGYWSVYSEKHLTLNPTSAIDMSNSNTANRTYIVATITETPYVMLKKVQSGVEFENNNDRYEGYCVDLLKLLAQRINFNYELNPIKSRIYGTDNGKGEWDGLIGELMNKKADLAVAPLTITYDREQVVDFSKPFMFLGITILYRVPEPQNPGVFSFLSPLAFDVWLYVVIAYLLVALSLFLLARFSPYEWYNSHPCNPEYDEVENQFSFFNCLWFSFGGLMQQGSEINPRSFSTRVLSGFWWFFSLILISSYTANLAAFLTVERMVSPIQSADDLAKQTTIEYGTLAGGSSETFFRNSKIDTYKAMWEYMSEKPGVLTVDYKEGIDRVLASNKYAFLMESTTAEYTVSQHCNNLTLIGGLLNSRGYGVGTPLGSPLRDEITKVILQLQEEDILLQLKKKWWKTDKCVQEHKNKEDANELDLSNIGGIFLVLLAGLIVGLITAVCEFVWKSRQNAEIDRKSLCGEMMAEMRFACRCNRKRRMSKTIDQSTYIPAPMYHRPSVNGNAMPLADTVA